MWDKYENISDELLAAFLDGNTTREETELVLGAMRFDDELMELVDVGLNIENFDIYSNEIETNSHFDEENDIFNDRFDDELTSNEINESINNSDMDNSKIGFAQADTSWGKPELDIKFDPTTYQYYSDTCAFQSQAIVLHEFGIDVTQEQLVDIAKEQGWYVDGYGTPTDKVGKLLEYFNVDANFTEGNNIFNLANELAQGHQIIVTVDSGELWEPSLSEHLEDVFWGGQADHALVVVGIDTSDVNDVKVIVTDPGNGNNQMAYSEKQFMEAWKDSDCFMVATKESPESFAQHYPNSYLDTFADIPYPTIQSLAFDDIDIENEYYADFFNKFMENPDDLSALIDEYQDSVFMGDVDNYDNNDII